jgi:pimeloyl-ACP methyl ester carboxylesterase
MSDNPRQLTRDGVTINYSQWGSGPAILLIHGFPDALHLWRHQVPVLVEAGYHVITADNRGLGQSSAPAGASAYTLEDISEDLLAVLEDCSVDRVAVVGHDWGAAIGWALVEKLGERTTCFVPMSVGAPQCYASCDDYRQKEIGWYTLLFQMEGLAEQLLMADDWKLFRQWTRQHNETAHWIDHLSRDGRLVAGLHIYRANLLDTLTSGREYTSPAPTLGLWSSGDNLLVEEQMVASGRFVRADWRYEKVDGASHWMMLDRPEHINRLLLNFIGQHRPAT